MSDIPTLAFINTDEQRDTFNCMLFGPMGTGKSVGAATSPGPILWINAEGEGAIQYPKKVAKDRGTDILEVRLPARGGDYKGTLSEVMGYYRNPTGPEPKTVVIDTIGALRGLLAKQIVVGPGNKSRDQWGEVADILRDFVLFFRDKPVNLVILAHEDIQDEDGERIVEPKIGGALQTDIPKELDVVAYTGVIRDQDSGDLSYHGQFVGHHGRRCKDRSGGGLGEHRPIDVSEWLETFRAALAPDDSDLPFSTTKPVAA